MHNQIDLNAVRHNDLPVYLHEGYGNKPIHEWPFYKYIKLYLNGDHETAKREWQTWLIEQFGKYHSIDKRHGGMQNGSMHHLSLKYVPTTLRTRAQNDTTVINIRAATLGASDLVRRRLDLVDSITSNGYKPRDGARIVGIRKRGAVILKGGHHRAATLLALSYETIECDVVLPPIVWSLRKWMAMSVEDLLSRTLNRRASRHH